jgi:hypothetical protein
VGGDVDLCKPIEWVFLYNLTNSISSAQISLHQKLKSEWVYGYPGES